ncbi:hypothetical protein MPTK1_1g28680 [Marchantia polymorpha subsp. ruderalis]|uniref:Uncharacterized protein n=2 Tax=Marchantia polymorpha TaxID=3197 RepID=A0A176VES5_MARPO|nr:hypothetical protein AXG93_4129s1180 [Marchantia polymorpha subsp. ruderalis]PTQ49499.1 hypothetical protein MARPO_0002s0012 [Marchantia polymorpha]BBN00384.1 hypothetical protein Mp_1g28680 [Marchantia polymorpha subsp. ruderalis]|eukprot:PTQ49499.1 hypothetical protein MARPO_0002s0012 [Marchantia polymorpha]
MPSGPKKRMKLRRKKQGSPATDANLAYSETEGLSISGSMDVDELDVDDVDTPTLEKPGDCRARPTFDDKDAVSSQTEEWVRVSNFDVGTPTSQTGENEPLFEDADISTVRRSLDKLAEWESVSGDHTPEAKDGSTNSLEEEQSKVEVEESAPEGASGHSSESFLHLSLPQSVQEKDSDIDRRSVRSDSSSSTSTSSSSSSDAHSTPLVATSSAGGDSSKVPPPTYESVVAQTADDVEQEDEKEIVKSNGDPVEKVVVHEGQKSSSKPDDGVPEEKEMKVDEAMSSGDLKTKAPTAADISEDREREGKAAADDLVVDAKPPSSTFGVLPPEADEIAAERKAAVETIAAASPIEEKEITASAAKDISEVDTPLDIPVETPSTKGEAVDEDKEVLSLTEETRIPSDNLNRPGEDEKAWLEAAVSGGKAIGSSILDAGENVLSEDKEVASLPSDDKHKETESIASVKPSAATATAGEDKEAASTSTETEESKKLSANVPEFESALRIHESKTSSGDQTELIVDQVTVKPSAPPSNRAEQQQAVVEESHLTVDTNRPAAVKNGIVASNLRPHMEQKSMSGCCGVIYWLLGRDH